MEQVLQCYGKGIAAGIVLIAVMVLLFAGIRDDNLIFIFGNLRCRVIV